MQRSNGYYIISVTILLLLLLLLFVFVLVAVVAAALAAAADLQHYYGSPYMPARTKDYKFLNEPKTNL